MFISQFQRSGAPSGWRSRLPWRSRGFTLIELLTVIVILGAVAALVVGNFDGTRKEAESTVANASLHVVREAINGSGTAPGYLSDMETMPNFRNVDFRIHDLFSPESYPTAAAFDPLTKRGWRGPYLLNNAGRFPAAGDRRFTGDTTFLERNFYYDSTQSYYALPNDLAIRDAWGNPIVFQTPPVEAFSGTTGDAKRFRYARLVSAGPDGILSTPRDRLAATQADGSTSGRGDDLVLFLNRADLYEVEEP